MKNFKLQIESINNLVKIWTTRNLAMKGKNTVINSLLLPKLIYPCTILTTPEKTIVAVEKIIQDFFWNWKRPKIKKDVLVRGISAGGIKLPCVRTKIEAWKLMWAIRCLKYESLNPLWSQLVSEYLPDGLTLESLLKSRPSAECLTRECCDLPVFYGDIIHSWVKIKNMWKIKTKEQVKQEYLWLNSFISVNKKTVQYKM